ncbi:hypothetical protein NDU88_003624 [Pleurodeles waltl]|uniref:Uncharacterized protein n=1 Tax=Pleurodeles waltl TaxID=8319 RepID=A0AAV7M5V0_PLEWA|nr:hypothetical protein NDU88_003624 [Pleurodeles waltl]
MPTQKRHWSAKQDALLKKRIILTSQRATSKVKHPATLLEERVFPRYAVVPWGDTAKGRLKREAGGEVECKD